MDAYGRTIDYLRISVTDRCDERCLYCMPEGYRGWQPKDHPLTAKEILRVVRTAAQLGFRKFRLTGGEPLIRPDLVEIVAGMAAIPLVQCIGLSTNGIRLEELVRPLKNAGLRTVNISLDALDPKIYRRITGGEISSVLAGIRAALAAGFEFIKLNCVLMKGITETELWPLVLFAAEHRVPLRLIELMPVSNTTLLAKNFFPISEAMRILSQRDELSAQSSTRIGWGPAKYYRLRHSGALVGFIGALTDAHFCEACNKMRLTADGKVRPCLGDHGELDLREMLRNTSSEDDLRRFFIEAINRKPLEHSFRAHFAPCRPMTAIGG